MARPTRRSAPLRTRTVRVSATLLVVLTAAGGALAGSAHATSGRIAFYGDLGNPVNSPSITNPRLVRPATIALTEDGSWALEKLRWSGWGKSVARATGISSSSNCVPNCATGKRTNMPARLALSSPGRVRGHRVYRCFELTVPSHPRSDEHDCLERQGSLIVYKPAASSARRTHAEIFTPSRNISCELFDTGSSRAAVTCDMQKPPAIASLSASGSVTICQHQGLKCTGNLGLSPTPPRKLAYGRSIRIGRFRCSSAITGLTCVVTATGKGFFISKRSVRRLV